MGRWVESPRPALPGFSSVLACLSSDFLGFFRVKFSPRRNRSLDPFRKVQPYDNTAHLVELRRLFEKKYFRCTCLKNTQMSELQS